jgi:hypothetical protein
LAYLALFPLAFNAVLSVFFLSSITSWTLVEQLGFLLVMELCPVLLFCWYWRRLVLFAWRARRFRTRPGSRVVVHYSDVLHERRDFAALQQRCEDELDDLARWFGFSLRRPVAVFLFEEWKDISKIFGEHAAGTAITLANAIVVADDPNLQEMLRHELAHLFSARWSSQAPPLLNEGLSTWLEVGKDGRTVDWITGALLRRVSYQLSDLLKTRFFYSTLASQRSTCYILAGSFTGFLIRHFGWDRYRTLFRKVRPGSFRDVFRKVLGLSLEEAEKQWRDQVLAETTVGKNGHVR